MIYKHKLFLIFSFILFFVLMYTKYKYIENMDNMDNINTSSDGTSSTNNMSNLEQYDPSQQVNNNPLFLAMKNAADISILKDQVKELSQIKERVSTLETNVKNNTTFIQDSQTEDINAASAIQSQL